MGRRLFVTVLTLIGLMALVFLMTKAIPGDEARVAAGPEATEAQIEVVRQRLGLDKPLPVQFLAFAGHYARGDLGTSISTLQPVLSDLLKVLPSTMELVVAAMSLCLIVSVPAAAVAAARHHKTTDLATRIFAVTIGGLPTFWLALMLQYVVATRLRWLPISGQQSFQFVTDPITGMPVIDSLLSGFEGAFGDALSYIILPAVALSALFISQTFRMLRAALLGILDTDFISAVRAKGASPFRIMLKHALPNTFGPMVTLVGTQFGLMLGSAVLVEGIFARPGIGSYLTNAVAQKDTHAVVATVFFVGTAVCVINLIADLAHLVVDPRVGAAQFSGAQA
ncbi:ABC transporter permease [Pararhizobium sp. O133]|uniref:ABC transporter permease n=1 Tax=Pararhizobium sp. O133 TaxID=3449278 RepID=UPI003F688EA8